MCWDGSPDLIYVIYREAGCQRSSCHPECAPICNVSLSWRCSRGVILMVILRVCAGKRNGSLLRLWAPAAPFGPIFYVWYYSWRWTPTALRVHGRWAVLPSSTNQSVSWGAERTTWKSTDGAKNWKSNTFNYQIRKSGATVMMLKERKTAKIFLKKAEQVGGLTEHMSGFQYTQRIKKDQLTTGPSSPASPFSPEGPAGPRRPASPCLPGGPPSPLIPLGPSFPGGPAGPAGPGLPWKKDTPCCNFLSKYETMYMF